MLMMMMMTRTTNRSAEKGQNGCVRVCSGLFGFVRMCSDLFGCVRVCSDLFGVVRICLGLSGFVWMVADAYRLGVVTSSFDEDAWGGMGRGD